jgi:uncharacterized protein (DUF305 family)
MKRLIVSTALAAALLVAACGDDDTTVTTSAAEEDQAAHNDADASFVQEMIVHHEQAIDMSQMVLDRGDDPQVRALAERIEAAQQPEIDQMRGWLQEWDEPEAPEDDHGSMDAGDGEPTMMTEDEMEQLAGASGSELDVLFLEMMIRHHEGAVAMAETQLEQGQHPDALELARNVIDDQTAEIEEMQGLLDGLG